MANEALSEVCEYLQNGKYCQLKALEPSEPFGDCFCDYTNTHSGQGNLEWVGYNPKEAKSCPIRLRQSAARTLDSPAKLKPDEELITADSEMIAHWHI